MNYNLQKYNNNKKLIIGITTFFCVIILIIGATIAYFTQSGIGETGNIIATNTNGTIGYTDNKDYMRNNLIPVIDTDVVKFAMKNSLNNYTDNDICKFNDEYNACSLYEFTITNNANVTQELLVSMSPTLNQYGNLYFIVFEGNRTSLTSNSKIVHYSTHIEQETINFSDLNLKLEPSTSKTYTIVFYIKSLNIDQTSVDSGKTYAATINVNSVTTGDYLSISVGEGCYESEALDDGTYKLTKFKGINEDGSVVEGCGVTKDNDGFYSVIVPSTYGGQQISTLGNTLFFFADLEVFDPSDMSTIKINKNSYIKEFTINEGITTLEDGFLLDAGTIGKVNIGTFAVAGYDYFAKQVIVEEGVKFNLPNSLKYIGNNAFIEAYIKEIDLPNNLEYIGDNSFYGIKNLSEISIPSSVKIIGENAFYNNSNLTTLIFKGAVEGTSQLTTIGDYAFDSNNIQLLEIPSSVTEIGEYAFAENNISSLIIPSSVTLIGEYAFYENDNLTTLEFVGAVEGTSQLTTIGDYAFDSNNIQLLEIPSSVKTIGISAFGSNVIKILEFKGAKEGTSQLMTIGDSAFYNNYLTYNGTNEDDYLFIPASVISIGSSAFGFDTSPSGHANNLKFIRYMGTREQLDLLGTNWYNVDETLVKAYGE